jgi:hypothetical protein
MNLNILSGFMQVLHITRKHYTKNVYFPMHILFTTFYLLQKQKLNYNKYSDQKINMRYFIQANEYYINMHAKIQFMNMHGFFVNNSFKFWILGILYILKHRSTQEDSYKIYFVFFWYLCKFLWILELLYEFLKIFNQITDFGNGKRMNSIGPASGPRLHAVGLAQGSAPPKAAHNDLASPMDSMGRRARRRSHHARDRRSDVTIAGMEMVRAPFLLHHEHEGGEGNTPGKQRDVGAHPSGATPARVEKWGQRRPAMVPTMLGRPIDWKWLRDGAHRRGVVATVAAPNPAMATVSFGAGADNRPRGGLEGGS